MQRLTKNMTTAPRHRAPRPIASGDPTPKMDVDPELFKSKQDLTNRASMIRPPSVGITPKKRKFLVLANSTPR
jgi:hypothetical protein